MCNAASSSSESSDWKRARSGARWGSSWKPSLLLEPRVEMEDREDSDESEEMSSASVSELT
jgi:hypothetical protein